jgi:hypothetical protein
VNQHDNVNVALLRELYDRTPVNHAFFDWLANRERPRSETKIDTVEAMLDARGIEHDRAELTRLLRELEETGCGDYVAGRRGRQSRFLWSHNLISVGRTASGVEDHPTPLAPRVNSRAPVRAVHREIAHVFNLRPDFRVALALPQDFTREEAERLAAFVRTLPFDV